MGHDPHDVVGVPRAGLAEEGLRPGVPARRVVDHVQLVRVRNPACEPARRGEHVGFGVGLLSVRVDAAQHEELAQLARVVLVRCALVAVQQVEIARHRHVGGDLADQGREVTPSVGAEQLVLYPHQVRVASLRKVAGEVPVPEPRQLLGERIRRRRGHSLQPPHDQRRVLVGAARDRVGRHRHRRGCDGVGRGIAGNEQLLDRCRVSGRLRSIELARCRAEAGSPVQVGEAGPEGRVRREPGCGDRFRRRGGGRRTGRRGRRGGGRGRSTGRSRRRRGRQARGGRRRGGSGGRRGRRGHSRVSAGRPKNLESGCGGELVHERDGRGRDPVGAAQEEVVGTRNDLNLGGRPTAPSRPQSHRARGPDPARRARGASAAGRGRRPPPRSRSAGVGRRRTTP